MELTLELGEHQLVRLMLGGQMPVKGDQYRAKDKVAAKECVALKRAFDQATEATVKAGQEKRKAEEAAGVPENQRTPDPARVTLKLNGRAVDRLKDIKAHYEAAGVFEMMPWTEWGMSLDAKLAGKEMDLPDMAE